MMDKKMEEELKKLREDFAKMADIFTRTEFLNDNRMTRAQGQDMIDRQLALFFTLDEFIMGLELTLAANGIPRKIIRERAEEYRKKVEPNYIEKLKKMQEEKFERSIGG